ncbi:MAG: NADH:ubiquinone oxidoreductase [Bacteroidales bacterium]|jgi:Ni,Fe-hydrogenase III small subunit|nr:NADH:ubiquinone oxidoreductase [Bacteroidales bacterium]NCU35269.1 NADH:ubiquinone oxidoreductase [Candidatus Falkowbacteria bacterium]MDD2633254.1 NADH:ubiquinone oxidoreductase [Bacteroidales bacterium]MDD3131081.1 NADH:ubiquinone oxidoreductase [Bacteroidales bacterium]MDD3526941.1 NADH:ubiquinone oxidoreductase [Bacteroidales bacterium]
MINEIKVMLHNGRQYIPDLRNVKLRAPFRGRPEISTAKVDEQALADVCPLQAILTNPVRIDMGKCAFCGECAFAFPEKIKFSQDYLTASNVRENLIVKEGERNPIIFEKDKTRKEVRTTFSRSIKLRQVSAGGDNSCEYELGASGNANFDMGRYGIEFVASPRHADGVVITGPVSENMAEALQICYDAIPSPKIIVLVGVDAISGGLFAGSPAINRSFLDKYYIDLFIPGNPVHPLTFVNAILDLTR